ncbi:MAG: hypothetical protein LBG99_09245 [Propionibacteriaceae bacterium]|jgi:hypothetical protein|nr:hypothetical protein [Propionibacteriaceae bacterium]
MSSEHLIEQAQKILDGSSSLPGVKIRLSLWYARAALEEYTVARLDGIVSCDPADMTMASRLIFLKELNPDVGQPASYAWWALSRACHYHAFELTPTQEEAEHLVGIVARVCGTR